MKIRSRMEGDQTETASRAVDLFTGIGGGLYGAPKDSRAHFAL